MYRRAISSHPDTKLVQSGIQREKERHGQSLVQGSNITLILKYYQNLLSLCHSL